MAYKHCAKHHEQYPEDGACKYCAVEATETVDIHKMTKAQLVEYGATLGLYLSESDTKDELIRAIEGR